VLQGQLLALVDHGRNAFYRARNLVKSDGRGWNHELPKEEIARQFADAADRVCPRCSDESCA
jgi:hypothetical protein